MYRNLNPQALGISGRQSEIIELALTYGFRGLELDIDDFAKRSASQGVEQAAKFLTSAHIKIAGYELPVAWRGDEAAYKAGLAKLDTVAGFVAKAGGRVCHTTVQPATDSLPYHENFEMHRQRLAEIAEVLARHTTRLAIGFLAAPAHRAKRQFQFIHEAEALVTLLKSIAASNVGLALDTWNWQLGGGTVSQLKTLGVKQIVTVTLADSETPVAADAIADEQRVIPHVEGVIDNLGVLTLLQEAGFAGPVSVVPHPNALDGMTRETIVQSCSSALDELWKAAGIAKAPKLTPAGASA